MSDNIAITPGSGATVATDDVSGIQYQRVKVNYGADGAATDVDATHGLPVKLADGDLVTLGAMTDAKSSATDATSVTIMKVLKQISYQLQLNGTGVVDKHWSQQGVLVANAEMVVTTAAATVNSTAFTPVEVEIVNVTGAAAITVILGTTTLTGTTSSAGSDTIAVSSHGLGTTNTVPVTFSSVSFTSTPTITTNTVIYYAKGSDANNIKIYTDVAASSLVDITSAAASTMHVVPAASASTGAGTAPGNAIAVLPATPSSIILPSYNTAPVVRLVSASNPGYAVILRGT